MKIKEKMLVLINIKDYLIYYSVGQVNKITLTFGKT